MKKLIKSEVYGSMNSTPVYCLWDKSQHKLLKKLKKKKKKEKTQEKKTQP